MTDLTSERETWDRACDKVNLYQCGHETKRMSYEECLQYVETENKSLARRVD